MNFNISGKLNKKVILILSVTVILVLTLTGYIYFKAKNQITEIDYGKFVRISDMNIARSGHKAILLPDGNVLIFGGSQCDKPEIYNSKTRKFELINNDTTKIACYGTWGEPINLPDGRILFKHHKPIPGFTIKIKSLQIFNPKTKMFSVVNRKDYSKYDGILLNNGKYFKIENKRAILYDPKAQKTESKQIKSSKYRYFSNEVIALPDNKALILLNSKYSNFSDTLGIYNPEKNELKIIDSMSPKKYEFKKATLLDNENILLVWHRKPEFALVSEFGLLQGIEHKINEFFKIKSKTFLKIYNIKKNKITFVGNIPTSNNFYRLTKLSDEKILIIGCSPTELEKKINFIFNPNTFKFYRIKDLNKSRWWHTLTLLRDNTVLITGGVTHDKVVNGKPVNVHDSSSAELFIPKNKLDIK